MFSQKETAFLGLKVCTDSVGESLWVDGYTCHMLPGHLPTLKILRTVTYSEGLIKSSEFLTAPLMLLCSWLWFLTSMKMSMINRNVPLDMKSTIPAPLVTSTSPDQLLLESLSQGNPCFILSAAALPWRLSEINCMTTERDSQQLLCVRSLRMHWYP